MNFFNYIGNNKILSVTCVPKVENAGEGARF